VPAGCRWPGRPPVLMASGRSRIRLPLTAAGKRPSKGFERTVSGERTPISRPKSSAHKTLCNVSSRHPHQIFRAAPSLNIRIAPVFSTHWLRSASHQTPIGIKRVASDARFRRDGFHHPRKTLVPNRVHENDHTRVAACEGASPERAHDLGDSFIDLRLWHKHNVQSLAIALLQSASMTRCAWPNC